MQPSELTAVGAGCRVNVIASIYPVMEDKRKRQTEVIKRKRE